MSIRIRSFAVSVLVGCGASGFGGPPPMVRSASVEVVQAAAGGATPSLPTPPGPPREASQDPDQLAVFFDESAPADHAAQAAVRIPTRRRGRFTAVANDRREDSDPQVILQEALAGTVSDAGGALDSRMQVRPIAIPAIERNGHARFNFGDGQRGWVAALPGDQMLATPAFGDGRLFVGGGFASHELYALDAYTGESVWTLPAPDGGPSAAVLEEGNVIFNTESCTLFVANARTGALIWSRYLGDPLMSQPAAAEGLVVSAYPTGGGHHFGAFRLTDGEPVWDVPIAADVIAAPQIAGDSVYFATMDGTAYGVALRTGRVAWRAEVGASSALWIDRGRALLARRIDGPNGPRERMIVLDASTGRVAYEGVEVDAPYLAGQSRDRTLARDQQGGWGSVPHGDHLGLTNVSAGWAFQGSTPAVADGRAYFAIGGEIHAREIATGDTVWQRRYANAGDAQALSPPAVVGSLLVFGTVDGQLFATDIDTGMTVWAYDLGAPIVYQPIVAQGWVYAATGHGEVIGLELGDALLDGWHMWGGNARHAGLVETAGRIDPHLVASLTRPTEGTLEPVGGGGALPLRGTEVDARVSGPAAEVYVTQRFQSSADHPLEAVYLFPLPPDSAVDEMQMRVGDRVLHGVILERNAARAAYDEARQAGRRAALLEQQRPNLFAQRVANIQPGERIDVRLRYVELLAADERGYELDFPMIAPRRFDPSDPTHASASDTAVSANTALADQQPPVRLHVEVDPGLPIASIASPSHPAAHVERVGDGAVVDLRAVGADVTRDFVLRWTLDGTQPDATVLAHRDESGGYFALLVQPPRAPEEASIAPRDVTFVVDTSSSMQGRPIEQARAMIRRSIAGLRPADRFNVIAFSDRIARLDDAPLANEAETRARAERFVGALRATGATQMIGALGEALRAPTSSERLSIVVLVTDGYIANEADVLRTLATQLGDHRLYAFGVGAAVNRFLVERVAEIGRGRAIVAALADDPDAVAARFAASIDRPLFTDVEIDYGSLHVHDVYPRRMPDLFAGQPLIALGRFDEGGHATVRVRGSVAGHRYERAIEVELPRESGDRNGAQASLWARAAVHDRLNRLTLRDDPELIAEVTHLGLEHHLVTPYTSFVAVDR